MHIARYDPAASSIVITLLVSDRNSGYSYPYNHLGCEDIQGFYRHLSPRNGPGSCVRTAAGVITYKCFLSHVTLFLWWYTLRSQSFFQGVAWVDQLSCTPLNIPRPVLSGRYFIKLQPTVVLGLLCWLSFASFLPCSLQSPSQLLLRSRAHVGFYVHVLLPAFDIVISSVPVHSGCWSLRIFKYKRPRSQSHSPLFRESGTLFSVWRGATTNPNE